MKKNLSKEQLEAVDDLIDHFQDLVDKGLLNGCPGTEYVLQEIDRDELLIELNKEVIFLITDHIKNQINE